MDKINIGIIGVGQIGKLHIENYRKIPGAQLVAVADLDRDEAERVATENDIPRIFTDFRELLKLDEISAVDVCLHNNLHAPVSIAAMEAGKDVYCEKPMAGSYADALAMHETAKRLGRKLSIQLMNLFSMEVKAARRLIEAGHLGKLYYARSVGFRRRGRPFVDGYGSADFARKEVAAGGALYDMGVYHIALILYLLGNSTVKTVTGTTHQEIEMYADRRKSSRFDVEELGLGLVRLAGDVTLAIEESWAMHFDSSEGSKILGSKGGVKLNPFTYFSTVCDMEMDATFDLSKADWRWHRCIPDTDAYDSPQHHWVATLQGRVSPIDTAQLALAVMLISEGIYLSARLGHEVTADEIKKNSRAADVKV